MRHPHSRLTLIPARTRDTAAVLDLLDLERPGGDPAVTAPLLIEHAVRWRARLIQRPHDLPPDERATIDAIPLAWCCWSELRLAGWLACFSMDEFVLIEQFGCLPAYREAGLDCLVAAICCAALAGERPVVALRETVELYESQLVRRGFAVQPQGYFAHPNGCGDLVRIRIADL